MVGFAYFCQRQPASTGHPTAWDSAGPPSALVKSCSTKPGTGESHRGTNGSNGGNGARRTSFAIHLAEPGNLQGQLLKVPQRQALVIGCHRDVIGMS